MNYIVRIKDELNPLFVNFCKINNIKTSFEELGWFGNHKGTFLYTATMPVELATALKISLPVMIIEKTNA